MIYLPPFKIEMLLLLLLELLVSTAVVAYPIVMNKIFILHALPHSIYNLHLSIKGEQILTMGARGQNEIFLL